MWKSVTVVALALAIAIGLMPVGRAEADRGAAIGLGIAAGVIAGAAIGAHAYGPPRPRYYSYSSGPVCYRGPRECDYVGRSCWYNRYGDYVCRGGEYRCYYRRICD
jgi:hypothetical protein